MLCFHNIISYTEVANPDDISLYVYVCIYIVQYTFRHIASQVFGNSQQKQKLSAQELYNTKRIICARARAQRVNTVHMYIYR